MSLNAAQKALRDHLDGAVDVDPLAAIVPAHPVAFAGYIWPADAWIEPEEGASFCASRSVGMVLDLTASVADLVQAQVWLNDRVDEVWAACADGVDVGGDDVITSERARAPFVISTAQGVELLVVRIEFTRFTLED